MNIQIKISKRRIAYKFAMKILHKRVEDLKQNKGKELLWILQHPTTFTAGVRSKNSEIIDKKIKIIYTNRGGKVTLHSPGQILVYFVLNLNKRKKDIRKLISVVEKSIIQFLLIYKIKSRKDKKNIGIWVNNKKIAAIGLRVSRWIAYHGCSININNNLNLYQKILPCGLNNQKITSVYSEKNIALKNFEKKLADIFLQNINKI